MLVLGPIVDEKQDSGTGHSIHESIEHFLRSVVDPVQILDDENNRPLDGESEYQAPESVEHPFASLRWVELFPLVILGKDA